MCEFDAPKVFKFTPKESFNTFKNFQKDFRNYQWALGHIGFYCNVMKYGTSAVELGDSELEIEQFWSDKKSSFSPSSTVLF